MGTRPASAAAARDRASWSSARWRAACRGRYSASGPSCIGPARSRAALPKWTKALTSGAADLSQALAHLAGRRVEDYGIRLVHLHLQRARALSR